VSLDWKCQEITIAGAKSGDEALLETGLSAHAYIDLAVKIGYAPEGATKVTQS
jgi:hypothetical protein